MNNKRQILEIIFKAQGIYRAQIAELTTMSNQTVTNLVKELVAEGVIVEAPIKTNAKGRAPIALAINLSAQYTIGVELSVNRLVFILSRADGEEVERLSAAPGEDVLGQVKTHLKTLIDQVAKQDILGIGISIEGVINEATGQIISSKDLGLNSVNLLEELDDFGVPTLLRHDVNVLAEVHAYTSESENMMLAKIDQGIGSSFILNGKILKSESTVVGELGHVRIHSLEAPKQCRCGKKGCLTMEASVREVEKLFGKPIEAIGEAFREGDGEVRTTMTRIAGYIAEPISNLISVLGLEKIVLTGRMFEGLGHEFYSLVSTLIEDNLESWNKELKLLYMPRRDVAKCCCHLVVSRYYTNESELY